MSDFAAPLSMPTTNGEMASYGDDRKLIATFSREAVHMTFKSELEGRQVWEDQNFIHIVTPGGKSDMKRPVKMESDTRGPSDLERFPRQWQAFQNQTKEVHDGLPIEQWPPLSKSHVMALKAAQVYTVEQLAGVADSAFQHIGIMDMRKYRDMAIAYFETAKGGAPITALTAENERLKTDMEIMQRQIAELAANQKQKPGRKPQMENEE